jgi:hypothetical protein
MKWKSFGSKSKPIKSLAKLQEEVIKLKEAEAKTDAYQELQKQKEIIQKDIKLKGFQIRHRKALNLISKGESIIGNIARKSEPYIKKGIKELKKPIK